MVWGAIRGEDTGPLYFVEGTMRQDQYKQVIETILLPYLKEKRLTSRSFTFMQDGAPCHTAKSIKSYLKLKNIPLLEWPGNSPDLNPIENVWSLLKQEVNKFEITNRATLKEKIISEWKNNLKIKKMIKSCIESMPRRIKEVIKAKGGNTKY